MPRLGSLLLLLYTALPLSAAAQVFDKDYQDPPDALFTSALGLYSDRVFRGQNLYDGTSVQLRGEAGIGTGLGLAYVGGFAHFSGDSNHGGENEQSFTEFDFEIGHRFYLDEMKIGLGHRWYTYSRSTERLQDSGEFFAELTTEVIAHPHFTATYDDDEFQGWYYEFGLEQPIPLGLSNEKDALVPFVTMGMSESLDDGSHPIYDDSGIAFVDAGARAIFNIADSVSLEPDLYYTVDIDDATDSDFVFGINLVGQAK